MIQTSQSLLHAVSVHGVGNQSAEESLTLSESPLKVEGELLNNLLLTYFLSNFKTPEYYSFSLPEEQEDDDTIHAVMSAVQAIFRDEESLHENSVKLAEHLYAITQHPNIKSGELYVAYFSGVVIGERMSNAVGIFKSESKEAYLKLQHRPSHYNLQADEGINIHKLDKGCLVLDESGDKGYKVLIVDNANRSEAQFWKNDFLRVSPWSDAFHHTHNFMNLTRQYVGEQLEEEFSVSKADKIDLLNRSVDFFKTREQFNQNEFESEVLGDASVIESFRNYEKTFMTESDISDNFEISAHAVKRQARIFKSVLKLDKNFHIYIHGNRELIEKGYDEVTRRHYYKLYFDQES